MEILQDLNLARQRWKQADALVVHDVSPTFRGVNHFFDEFNQKFGPLTMTSSFDHFRKYSESALLKLKSSSSNLPTPY